MPLGTRPSSSSSFALLTCVLFWSVASCSPVEQKETTNDLPARGLPNSSKYLPVQIGGIVAAYGVSLVLVAILLLSLSKRRREHLRGSDLPPSYILQPSFPHPDGQVVVPPLIIPKAEHYQPGPYSARIFDPNSVPAPYFVPSPSSSSVVPTTLGVSPLVDQSIVAADRAMAQQQLEEMYKYVMEHEEAKQKGIILESPVASPNPQRESAASDKSKGLLSKKGKSKPSSLNLAAAKEEKSQSKTSALFSSLLSPKKKTAKGISISSPIMTPMSGTFPQHESREMSAIPPRHYAPPPPPPIPTDQVPFGATNTRSGAPITPDISPQSVQTIDERIGASLDRANRSRTTLPYPERDPESATSENSQSPLVGLPSSPRPGSTFPSLPSSPRPGASFSRPNPPSAVRTGGTLPLRAYEEQLGSPYVTAQTTKQTVFERTGPLSPGGGRTPFTGTAVPYSPYQPFTPCVPITPGLVTKEDRKRMKRMVPKTPTTELVKSSEEIW
ncbi:uncharacterized protein TRIREDRAFT_64448 [Trichoderma reesei QM6a]|uniref:Predicted protein n=2 Tax=Hypocrea jecorina TaxID=51453 RepID=G0RNB8_HYPJQ|nr:uncharacterized protein TRIREDRAFT_64448 [Trichoderma reesei QM6a]EGR47357.1 predicted protein [Trichoderma reesei QM6a]ETS00759.1 hypothetical protein M419DRAFT_82880 [Trichoderma reesei RUT C-30]